MASRVEAMAHKEQPLRVVERVNLGGDEGTCEKWEEFHKLLARHSGERILAVLVGYPDPDSIASALAHRFLAQQFDIEPHCYVFMR